MESKNLWILTEERPKRDVLRTILEYLANDMQFRYECGELHITPVLDENGCFTFLYSLQGFSCEGFSNIFIKIVSGTSSFTDFIIFHQDALPEEGSEPLYAIEETKTDDAESRNTGVYQRASKFVYLRFYFQHTKMVMLYALQIQQKENPTDTYIFGTRLLLTLGVHILGKHLDPAVFRPFSSIDEIILEKSKMRMPPKGNVPVLITRTGEDTIEVSGRLIKKDYIGHDPSIGTLSLISAALRDFLWTGRIIITRHGLAQKHMKGKNKFLLIASKLKLEFEDLDFAGVDLPAKYWHYDTTGEKNGTIFLHTVVENYTHGQSIFENHAGCEKSYFTTPEGTPLALAKYSDREAYKAGDKGKKIPIPDLVLLDTAKTEIITIEGKTCDKVGQGIKELGEYGPFDELYLNVYYPEYSIERSVVLFGGYYECIMDPEVGFLLNSAGKMVLGPNAPDLFHLAIDNLRASQKGENA